MQDYDIKRGHYKNIEGKKLGELMREVFGSVEEDDGVYVSRFGALRELRVMVKDRSTLGVETLMDKNVSEKVALETIKKYNEFLFRATGFTSKERKKRLNEKLKKGSL